jgi:hypothetical protein
MRLLVIAAKPLCLFTLLAAFGCGGRHLQSVTLSPATADAKNFPSGQVTFTATGVFSDSSTPVQLTSKDVLWCMGGIGSTTGQCVGNANPGATLDQNGVAQCLPGFTGTTTVLAGTESSSPSMPDSGPKLKIFGSAQLTCP